MRLKHVFSSIWDYILVALLVAWVFFNSPEAFAQDLTTIERGLGLVSKYGWPIVAIVLSPLISWRITQWYKLLNKRIAGRKPHWLLMDVGSWLMVYGMTYVAWSIHSDNALFIAFIVACFHTGIVKYIFAKAPKPIVEALQYGAASEKTMLTVFAGKDSRSESRD